MKGEMMLKSIMKMISTALPEEQPAQNIVAQFCEEQISQIIDDDEVAKVFRTAIVDIANKDPEAVLRKLIDFANAVSDLHREVVNESSESVDSVDDDIDDDDAIDEAEEG